MSRIRLLAGVWTTTAALALAVAACSDDGGPTGPCAGVYCSNHGTCMVDDNDERYCECDEGYHASFLLCLKDQEDPCLGVSCGANGTCVDRGGVAGCDCDSGYHESNLRCVPDSGDPCEGVDCSGHGTCVSTSGTAECDCDTGYHPEGLACVEDTVDPCEGIDCSGHGSCDDTSGSAECICDSGYHPEGLACIEDTTTGGFCQEACSGDPDCQIGGQDLGYFCQDNRCTGTASGCTSDPECVALFAGWSTPCTSGGGECDAMMQVCIDIGGGSGRCAMPPGGMTCADFSMAEMQMPAIDGSGDVTVCVLAGVEDAECRGGACFNPCGVDADCQYWPGAPTCDPGTGNCVCTQDADCTGVDNVSVCNQALGRCECASDDDCTLQNTDVCNNGVCGCSSVDVCTGTPSFDGTTYVCE